MSHQNKQTAVDRYPGNKEEPFQATKELLDTVQHVVSKLELAEAELTALRGKITGDVPSQAFDVRELEKLKSENESLKSEISNKQRSRTEEIEAYKDIISKNEQFYQSQKKENVAITNKWKQENEILKGREERLRKEKNDVEKELASTKLRLSKLLGDKISDNNPGLADLSDENRPTKLGERYRQLYDNEWTEAYEVTESTFPNTSDTWRVRYLRTILMKVYEFCKTEFVAQDQELIKTLCHSQVSQTLPGSAIKQLKDLKRYTATLGITCLTEKCTEQRFPSGKLNDFVLKVKPYLQECVAVCWLMVVQDPPVVLHMNVQIGDPFDKSMYSAYTKPGNKFEFVVWPALLLHEKGPVLAKGTAQGRKSSSPRGNTGQGQSVVDMTAGLNSMTMTTGTDVGGNPQHGTNDQMVNSQKPLGLPDQTTSTVSPTAEGKLIDLAETCAAASLKAEVQTTVETSRQYEDRIYQSEKHATFRQQQQLHQQGSQVDDTFPNLTPNVGYQTPTNQDFDGFSRQPKDSASHTDTTHDSIYAPNIQSKQARDSAAHKTQLGGQYQPKTSCSISPGVSGGGQVTGHLPAQYTPLGQELHVHQPKPQDWNGYPINRNVEYQTYIDQTAAGSNYQHRNTATYTDSLRQSCSMPSGQVHQRYAAAQNVMDNQNTAHQNPSQQAGQQYLVDLGAESKQAAANAYGNAAIQGHMGVRPTSDEQQWFIYANKTESNPMAFVDQRLGPGVYMKCWNWVMRQNQAYP